MAQKPWTPEIDARLIHLRSVEKMKWEEISAALGWSRNACHVRYLKITDPYSRVELYRRAWTVEAEANVFRMRFTDKMTVSQIAKATGRTILSIASKLDRLQNGPARPRQVHFERPKSKIVPQDRLDDRDRRMMAERDLTAMFFGDPAPGQSALDRRKMERAMT